MIIKEWKGMYLSKGNEWKRMELSKSNLIFGKSSFKIGAYL